MKWKEIEKVANSLGDMPVEELIMRLARLGVKVGSSEGGLSDTGMSFPHPA